MLEGKENGGIENGGKDNTSFENTGMVLTENITVNVLAPDSKHPF